MLKKDTKFSKLPLLAVAISISFILGEVILRFWAVDNIAPNSSELSYSFGRDRAGQLEKQLKSFFDTRTKFEVYCDLKKKGIDSFPETHPSDLLSKDIRFRIDGEDIFPLSGIANQRIIFCNEWGKYVFIDSDEMGFRNPPNIWDSGKIQVALIGDSFTAGSCVPERDTIASIIRDKYPLTLTLGRAGNGPLIEYATLKEFLPSQKPRFVFWLYFEGNDLSGLRKELKVPFLQKYINSNFSFGLKNYQSEVNDQLKDFINTEIKKLTSLNISCKNPNGAPEPNILSHPCSKTILGCSKGFFSLKGWKYIFQKSWNRVQPHIFRLLPTSHPNYSPLHLRDYKPLYELLIPLVGQAKNTVESWGGKLIFVYLPDVRENKKIGMFEKEIKERILDMEVPFIDGNLVFQNELPKNIRKLYPNGNPVGHYNARGYSLIAQAMLRKISMEAPAK
jgi:hypothetical protein